MKDSEVIRIALDKYLGSPEQWCQRAWFSTLLIGSPANSFVISRCAEGAIIAALRDIKGQDSIFHDLGRICDELVEIFAESHPDIVEVHPDVVGYNDHPLMTYEGVRSVMEKYRAKLEEQGR